MPKKVRGESVKKEERGEGARGAPRSRAPWWWREGARPGGARGGMGSGIMETGWIFETGWIIAGLRAGGRARAERIEELFEGYPSCQEREAGAGQGAREGTGFGVHFFPSI